MEARYRSTLWACCFANFFQAVGSCFAILYVPLRGLYGLSFTDFGILVSLNFITQVASDVLFSKPVEKYGFRPFAVAAPLVSAAGLGLFAAAPLLFPQRPFAGFCAGMFLFAAAGGLQELLLSPILDALPIPEERKARSMSMLHSFFAWGQIFVVLATTGLLSLVGVVITNTAAARRTENKITTAQAVTDTKLDELTREVREHNGFARRMPVVEEQIKVANHRISDLEKWMEGKRQ